MFEFETLLEKNRGFLDETVLKRVVEAGYVLISKDGNMESDELDHIIETRARVIFLEDTDGGPVSWAAALICGQNAFERVLLSNPTGPLTIHLSREGRVKSIIGEQDLRMRYDRILTARISRAKRHQQMVESEQPAHRRVSA